MRGRTYVVAMQHDLVGGLVEVVDAAEGDTVLDLDGALVVHVVALLVQVERDFLLPCNLVTAAFAISGTLLFADLAQLLLLGLWRRYICLIYGV